MCDKKEQKEQECAKKCVDDIIETMMSTEEKLSISPDVDVPQVTTSEELTETQIDTTKQTVTPQTEHVPVDSSVESSNNNKYLQRQKRV